MHQSTRADSSLQMFIRIQQVKGAVWLRFFPSEKWYILPREMLVFEKVGSIQLRMDICPLWLVGCQFPVQSLCINLKCPWADCELKDSSISNSSKRISCSVRQMLSPETIFQAFQFFAALGSNSSGGAYLRGFDWLWSISRQRSCRKWSKFDHSTGI